MNGKVVPLGKRRRSRRSLALVLPDPPVVVEWEPIEGVYNVICVRCAEGLSTPRLDEAHDWAERHRCNPELAALTAAVTESTAA